MIIKTSELSGMQLDYAVDLVEGGYADYLKRHAYAEAQAAQYRIHEPREPLTFRDLYGRPTCPKYSTCWLSMGPIIEREGIEISPLLGEEQRTPFRGWFAGRSIDHMDLFSHEAEGITPLIAAARCYVSFMLGDEINIPEVLK
jgi:hypothetical protein